MEDELFFTIYARFFSTANIPLRDPALRREIEAVLAQIANFRAIAEERWAATGQSGVGSAIDQRFDSVFMDLLTQAEKAETTLQATIARNQHRFRTLQGLLIALCLGLFAFIGVLFYRYERRQAFDTSALRSSEKRYRAIAEDTPVLICRFLPGGEITYVNDAYCKYFGKAPEELVGRNFPSLIPEAERKTVMAGISALTIDSSTQSHEHQVIAPGGEIRWQRWTNRALFDDRGSLVAYQSVGEDITERRQSEEALRNSQETWMTTLDAVTDWISLIDPTTHIIISSSKSGGKITGRPMSDLIGSKCYKAVRNADEPHPDCPIQQVLQSRHREEAEICLGEDGPWISVSVDPVFDDNNEIASVVHIVRDISEKKRAEENLAEAYRIINRSPAVAFLWQNERGWPVEFVSENVEALTGYSSREFVGGRISYEEIIHSDDLERVAAEVARYSGEEGRTTFAHEPYRIVTKNGAVAWVEDKSYIRRDSRGVVTHFEGIVYDITAEMLLEEQLRLAQKIESVGRLAGGVAHDFNNMLGVILGYTEMAMERVDPAQPLFDDLQQIRTAAERSANLTRQLLAFARKQTVSPKVLDLNETVGGMLKMLQRLIGEDIDLDWLPEAGVWPVKMDPSQIDQILANLCVNARDAIEGVGKVTIETGNAAWDEAYCADHPGLAPGEYVLLAVSDNGCGMGKETLERLYEPFFTTKKTGKGTGLGLATVYGIVKQNRGFIDVSSEVGQGTSFKIYLPRHAAKATQMEKEGPAEPAEQGYETILVVEDETAILKMLTRMLERDGYTVLAASTPGEAIRLAGEASGQIHLLMTDVVMPEMNGRQLAKHLLTYYPNLKRLFMSGYTANVIAHHGVLDEGVQFLQKPFTKDDLMVKVREALASE